MCETSIPIRAGRVTNLSQPGTGQGERGNWTGSVVVVKMCLRIFWMNWLIWKYGMR